VYINNWKGRTREKVEVPIYGEPGAYVGLSGIDCAFCTVQAGNENTYAKVRFVRMELISFSISEPAFFIEGHICENGITFSSYIHIRYSVFTS
jgi:hypothetical protein